jgi:hypothetical protein
VGDLRVVHVSTHVTLRMPIERVKQPRILTLIRLAYWAPKPLGVAAPKIALAACIFTPAPIQATEREAQQGCLIALLPPCGPTPWRRLLAGPIW